MFEGVGVGGVAVGGEIRNKGATCGQCPFIGQEYDALHIVVATEVDATLRAFAGGVGAAVEEITPLIACQHAELSGSVAAVHNRIIHAPVGIGVVTCQIVGCATTRIVGASCCFCRIWHIIGCAAVPFASAPAEEVYPSGIVVADVLVSALCAVLKIHVAEGASGLCSRCSANKVILMQGEAERLGSIAVVGSVDIL